MIAWNSPCFGKRYSSPHFENCRCPFCRSCDFDREGSIKKIHNQEVLKLPYGWYSNRRRDKKFRGDSSADRAGKATDIL